MLRQAYSPQATRTTPTFVSDLPKAIPCNCSDHAQKSVGERLLDHRELCQRKTGKVSHAYKIKVDRADMEYRHKFLRFLLTHAPYDEWSTTQIARYRDCGKPFEVVCTECGEVEVRHQFCKNAVHCPTCQRIRVRQLRKDLEKKIPLIEADNRERVSRILQNISLAQQTLSHIREDYQALDDVSYGGITEFKSDLRYQLRQLIDELRPISHEIDFIPIKKALNACREAIREGGSVSTVEELIDRSKDLLTRQINYGWKHIVLPIKTERGRYKEAVDAIKGAFSKFARSQFNQPCRAFTANLEFGIKNGNVHLHVLYYGPFLDLELLIDAWRKFTTAFDHPSEILHIKDAYERYEDGVAVQSDTMEAIKYTTKTYDLHPKELREYGLATKGRKRFTRYGGFRNREPKKKRTLIGIQVQRDGGKDAVFDTRLNARCHNAKAEVIS